MNAPATKPPTNLTLAIAFRARCEARAHLIHAGEYDLHEALDELQADAAASGLVEEIGQDLVQSIMSSALSRQRTPEPQTEAEEPIPPKRPTPEATIEALMYGLRCGLSCLSDPGNRDRLHRCDANAIREIATRLLNMKARSNGARPDWTNDEVAKLIAAWEAIRSDQS